MQEKKHDGRYLKLIDHYAKIIFLIKILRGCPLNYTQQYQNPTKSLRFKFYNKMCAGLFNVKWFRYTGLVWNVAGTLLTSRVIDAKRQMETFGQKIQKR